MEFPVYLRLGDLQLHPHLVFEMLAYAIGFQVYRVCRRRLPDHVDTRNRWTLLAAAAVGAALGSKVLSLLNDPFRTLEHAGQISTWLGGKTIVGGLLGGWWAIEWVKKRIGVTESTGDVYVVPLLVATMIGRVGCFLTGLEDHTCGTPTSLPWGIDFGDGVFRHPTQIYEILVVGCCLLPAWFTYRNRSRDGRATGRLFGIYLTGYLAFRFVIDFWKPDHALLGMSGIQWACVIGGALATRHLILRRN